MRNDALLHARMSGLSCCARPGALSALLFGSMGLAQSRNESAFYAPADARLGFLSGLSLTLLCVWAARIIATIKRVRSLFLPYLSPSSPPLPPSPFPSHDDDADDDDDDHCGDHDDHDDDDVDDDDDDDDHRTP